MICYAEYALEIRFYFYLHLYDVKKNFVIINIWQRNVINIDDLYLNPINAHHYDFFPLFRLFLQKKKLFLQNIS